MNIKILKLNELEPIDIYKMFKLRVEVFIIEQKCLYQDIDKKDEDIRPRKYSDSKYKKDNSKRKFSRETDKKRSLLFP